MKNPYGTCPECGQPGVSTERRIDGNSFCAAGHEFKRSKTVKASPQLEGGHGSGILFHCPSEESFLLLERGPNGDQPGTWCCPGGGVEDNETIEEAARRECEEEMQYPRTNPLPLIHMHRDYNTDTGYTFHNHLALVSGEFAPILNDEHTKHKWFKAEQFPDNMHPGLKRSINAFKERHGTV